jgi:acetyl esterase/lipase
MIFLFFLPLILLVCFSGIAFFVNAAMFKPYKKIKPPAEGRKMTVKSGKNRLAGYLWNESGTRGLIVFAHGMGTGVEYYLPEIHWFAARGYKVFAFEYSGYPGSSGHFYGFPQAVIDLKNALDFIDDGSLPAILMGHSMGAYAVCAVRQYTDKRVDGIVAYAPFFSSDEAVIAEATGNMPKCGKLLCGLILPMQRILFGRSCNPTAVAGLSCANAPTLILQGSADVEVTPDGCALYAHRSELSDTPVTFRLIGEEGSNGHMTIIRQRGSKTVNEDTIRHVDGFLEKVLRIKNPKQ